MIFYFSGTGNSQFVALQMAQLLEDDIVSINRLVKQESTPSFHSERPLVFVMPTYSWRIPRVVEKWIRETDFTGNRDAYFVLTCGGSVGNAAAYAKKLCEKEHLNFCGLAGVVMPENYLALGPTPNGPECQSIINAAEPRIASLTNIIRAGTPFPEERISFADWLKSGPVNPLFYTWYVHDKGFTVSDACLSCGACAKRCPLNNIELSGGKPTWKGTCTHCMACIAGCPVEAIEYKTITQGRHRHYIMNDALCWENGDEKQ